MIQKHAFAREGVPTVVAAALVPVVAAAPFPKKNGGGRGRGVRTARGLAEISQKARTFHDAREKRRRRCVSSNGIFKRVFPDGSERTRRTRSGERERFRRRRSENLPDSIVNETKRESTDESSLSSLSRKDVEYTATHRSFEGTERKVFERRA